MSLAITDLSPPCIISESRSARDKRDAPSPRGATGHFAHDGLPRGRWDSQGCHQALPPMDLFVNAACNLHLYHPFPLSYLRASAPRHGVTRRAPPRAATPGRHSTALYRAAAPPGASICCAAKRALPPHRASILKRGAEGTLWDSRTLTAPAYYLNRRACAGRVCGRVIPDMRHLPADTFNVLFGAGCTKLSISSCVFHPHSVWQLSGGILNISYRAFVGRRPSLMGGTGVGWRLACCVTLCNADAFWRV